MLRKTAEQDVTQDARILPGWQAVPASCMRSGHLHMCASCNAANTQSLSISDNACVTLLRYDRTNMACECHPH